MIFFPLSLVIGDQSTVMFVIHGGVASEFHITLQHCGAFAVPRALKCQTFGGSALQTRLGAAKLYEIHLKWTSSSPVKRLEYTLVYPTSFAHLGSSWCHTMTPNLSSVKFCRSAGTRTLNGRSMSMPVCDRTPGRVWSKCSCTNNLTVVLS